MVTEGVRKSTKHTPKGYTLYGGSQDAWNALSAQEQADDKVTRAPAKRVFDGLLNGPNSGRVSAVPKKKSVNNVPRSLMNIEERALELAVLLQKRGLEITLIIKGPVSEYTGGQVGKGKKKPTNLDLVVGVGTTAQVGQRLSATALRMVNPIGGVKHIASIAAHKEFASVFLEPRKKHGAVPPAAAFANVHTAIVSGGGGIE